MENIQKGNRYVGALVTLTTLFFMWGFITCLNDLLIPYLRDVFELSHFQSNLVQFAFFMAYFVISLLYFLCSSLYSDPIQKVGYKNTICAGLVISAIACFLFFMEANSANPQFSLFLCALFLLGTGFTFLQIAANPLVSILGDESTSSSRLNLTQAFNSLGTTIAPVIGTFVLYNLFKEEVAQKSATAVQIPYLTLASVLLILAGVIFFSGVPSNVNQNGDDSKVVNGAGALKHPYLVFGMLGIFCYVGAEVTIGSNLVTFMTEELKDFSGLTLTKDVASYFLSFYWGGSMIGRFMGAVSMSKMDKVLKYILMAVIGLVAACVIFFVIYFTSDKLITIQMCWPFLVFLILNYLAFISANSVPSRTLGFFAVVNIILVIVMLNTTGSLSLWSVLAVGLFNSIMFSNVFTLAIDGLEEYTSQGSSLLVMMILGGALVPPIQGLIADLTNAHIAFAVPLLCYAYLMWYGLWGSKIGKKKVVFQKQEAHPESIVLKD